MDKCLIPVDEAVVAIVGLGYVGLPLALEIYKKHAITNDISNSNKVIGYDINSKRIEELRSMHDSTLEIEQKDMKLVSKLHLTSESDDLKIADLIIVTVPTPVDSSKKPDFSALINASKTVGIAFKKYQKVNKTLPVVVYESTVYPGATEEVCIPEIEKASGLIAGKDFLFGYSPERINPGDKTSSLSSIVKVTSGCCEESSQWIDEFYSKIINAGTYNAQSIKVAEASKILENTQRDLNIAFINEFTMILNKLNLSVYDVIDAASTKWNFLRFTPGLVGGHCIGVDPFYLSFKAQQVGHYSELLLTARRINDGMALWIVEKIILELCRLNKPIPKSKVLILGFTFKENCPDTRNTKVIDICNELKSYSVHTSVCDPIVDAELVQNRYQISLTPLECLETTEWDVIVLCVSHKEFVNFDQAKWHKLCSKETILFDLKNIVPNELKPYRL